MVTNLAHNNDVMPYFRYIYEFCNFAFNFVNCKNNCKIVINIYISINK